MTGFEDGYVLKVEYQNLTLKEELLTNRLWVI